MRTDSASMRASTKSSREANDRLAKSLGLDPAKEAVHQAEKECLRLCRLLPRAPDARAVRLQLEEACHKLLDAEAAFVKLKKGT